MAPMSAMSALVLGIGVAPFGAAGGKEPPSSWSCARAENQCGRAVANAAELH